MKISSIDSFFQQKKSLSKGLVLATVSSTEGSTYSKAGTYMLISDDGHFSGMLSGGCLEGDLVVRAKLALTEKKSSLVTYDLSNEDSLWGLGVGCDGLMHIFIQPLLPEKNYEPFQALQDYILMNKFGVMAIVVESNNSSDIGTSIIGNNESKKNFGVSELLLPKIDEGIKHSLTTKSSSLYTQSTNGLSILCALLRPAPKILILGAGNDAVPLVNFCKELGWSVSIQDHRPAYIESVDFGINVQAYNYAVNALADNLDCHIFDAVIVMTHHFEHDKDYLRIIAETDTPYVGLLGPKERKNKILFELGKVGQSLKGRIHGPAGLDIGGRGASAIALSIVSQIQQELVARKII